MVTVVIQGGLGNQLFQYAYGRALLELGKEVVFDVSFFDTNTKYTKREYLLDKFLINTIIKTTKNSKKQILATRLFNKIDVDRKVRYVPINNAANNFLADGYYNTEKYFFNIRDSLLKEIVLIDRSLQYKEWEQKIHQAKNPIIIHARRTDFLNSGFTNLNEKYYEKALEYFNDDCDIFAFSDDIEWLQKTLRRPIICISGNGLKDYEELMLMSLGHNFIIANSTFSWWGAWLSQYPNKRVIAPKEWFKSRWWHKANRDIVPISWIRI